MLSDHLSDKLNPITTRASFLLDKVTQKTASLDDYLADSIGNSIKFSWNNWLLQHPVILWLFNHPVIALIGGLLTIILTVRLLLTIYRAIANAIDRLWLWILRSPWLLLKFVFGWEKKPQATISNTTVTNYEVTNDSGQIQLIMERLDLIQQQQEQIIRDLAQLKQQPIAMKLKQIQLAEEKL